MIAAIDLNADLGEGGPHDARLIPLASSVNIACGGHAGDESTMRRALDLALAAGVAVGAHPGYEDPAHFGRRRLALPADAVTDLIHRQIARFLAAAAEAGAPVHHVKPHGALYLQACTDPDLAAAVAGAVAGIIPGCRIYVPAGSALATAGAAAGLRVVPEGFADRRYQDDGNLVPRSHPDAVIDDPAETMRQALQIAMDQQVTTISGNIIHLPASTLCVHGDGEDAVGLLGSLRRALVDAGVRISAD
jgi:UPF0271 protein